MEDLELLREYVERRSEPAFTELVSRHVHLVYSAALRVVGEPHEAEDVAQMVFLQLARKAGSLKPPTILSGWLYRTTCYVAADVRRTDHRRRRREETAMLLSEVNSDHASAWNDMAPVIEEAMTDLDQADQDVLLLRFFEGRSLREAGAALGITEDAAQKRVSRSLDKLRAQLERRGVAASSALLAPILATCAVQAAPPALAATVASTAMAGSAAAAGGGVSVTLLKAATLAKLGAGNLATLVGGILLLGGGIAFLAFKLWPGGSAVPASAPAVVQPASSTQSRLVVRGIVRAAADGKPVAGAQVRLAAPQSHVDLYRPSGRGVPTARTGPDGRFELSAPQPRDSRVAIVVDHEAGYALVSAEELEANPEVVVQPWGRIEGVLRIGQTPAANRTVEIGIWGSEWLWEWNLVSHNRSTKTDANGRFVFPRLAPVGVWLTHAVMIRPGTWRQSGHQYVDVLPGQTNEVQLGGTGRPVTGRVVWDSAEPLVFFGAMWAQPSRGMQVPPGWKDASHEWRRQYEREWRNSAEGEGWKREVRNCEFAVQPDGTFRVDDVPAGRYRLHVRAETPKPGGKGTRLAAAAEVEVKVPDMPEGRSDEPLDVGELRPKPVPHP